MVYFFNNFFLLLFISLSFSLSSCRNKLTIQQFLDEVNKDEDFVKIYKDSHFTLECKFKPTEMMALTDLRGDLKRNGTISENLLKTTNEKFSHASYFTLKIGLNNGEDILQYGIGSTQEYARRMNDMTFNLGRQVYILTEKSDTIRSMIFDIQRSYGMSRDLTILFAFPSQDVLQSSSDKLRFVYDDIYFGMPENIIFTFNSNKLRKKLPEIILNNHE